MRANSFYVQDVEQQSIAEEHISVLTGLTLAVVIRMSVTRLLGKKLRHRDFHWVGCTGHVPSDIVDVKYVHHIIATMLGAGENTLQRLPAIAGDGYDKARRVWD